MCNQANINETGFVWNELEMDEKDGLDIAEDAIYKSLAVRKRRFRILADDAQFHIWKEAKETIKRALHNARLESERLLRSCHEQTPQSEQVVPQIIKKKAACKNCASEISAGDCGFCKFFYSGPLAIGIPALLGAQIADKGNDYGVCRRHAPLQNGYPVVFKTDWCGDYKENTSTR